MNKLPRDKRIQIIGLLTEGMSLRAVTRITGVSINTVTKLLVDAGRACSDYQDRVFHGLTCRRVQVDEIWAFCYAKAKNVETAKAAPDGAGDIWTWTAIDADSKLIPSWYVGKGDADAAMIFISDLASRLAHRVQLTSDGHRPYLEAVEANFGADIDYAMLIKHYGDAHVPPGRYSPGPCVGATKERVEGNPDPRHISTSYAERSNLTLRMHARRFTRLTNAFSKKVENHAHAVALHMMAYNFVRIHKTLRCSPAMAAKVTTKLWDIADIVTVIEEWEIVRMPGQTETLPPATVSRPSNTRVVSIANNDTGQIIRPTIICVHPRHPPASASKSDADDERLPNSGRATQTKRGRNQT